ncbi:MAG: phosphatase PAP2 family protein [Candidatus Saccharimonadales bacterium]
MQTFIQMIADGAVFPVALIGTYALIFKVPARGRYAAYCRILMAGLTAFLIAKLLATLYQPTGERPFQILGVAPGAAYLDNPGFPSDHSLFVMAITLAVWFETKSKIITSILTFFVVLVCVGRVLALVHTPLDVIGGLVVACTGIVWYLNVPPHIKKSPTRRVSSA